MTSKPCVTLEKLVPVEVETQVLVEIDIPLESLAFDFINANDGELSSIIIELYHSVRNENKDEINNRFIQLFRFFEMDLPLEDAA